MWQLYGLSFHWYGMVVGVAVVLAWWNLERLTQQLRLKNLTTSEWLSLISLTLVCARAWHLVTDWQWYAPLLVTSDWWQLFAVWQGGLSILGAVVGIVFGLWWLRRSSFYTWLDCVALILPWSQAVGRLANWVNQELYGLPTLLPWGIKIDATHRVLSVQDLPLTTKFHPLFAYEAMGMLLLGLLLTVMSRKQAWYAGSTKLWWSYVFGYSVLRFWLDFLRIDRGPVFLSLGFNQWLLLICVGASLGWWMYQLSKSVDYTQTR